MALKLGGDFKLYRDTASSFSVPTWNEIDIARDITLNVTADEQDVTIRLSKYKLTEPTLIGVSVDFEMAYDHNHADFTALQTLFWAPHTSNVFALSTSTISTSGEIYVKFTGKLFGWTVAAPQSGGGAVAVTLKPSYDSTNVPVRTTV